LNAIEDIILFRISNYLLKFSLKYKQLYGNDSLQGNDWYEYVEYGTTNSIIIFLQKNGFSREVARYIKNNEFLYLNYNLGDRKISKKLLTCNNKVIAKEAKEVFFNNRKLFIMN
jgi:hypothetical protein